MISSADMYASVEIIIENDLCISCGACVHVCPHENIKMVYEDSRGKYDAKVSDSAKCAECDAGENCLYVCPAYSVDYDCLAGASENGMLGRVRSVYTGWSEDGGLRLSASSGGFIRECAKSLLSEGRIDGIISLKHKEGLNYEPDIITDFSGMPNSVYHNVNYYNAFKMIMNNEGRYLLIGLPCQLTSVNRLLSHEKYAKYKDRVYAMLSLICGYSFDRKSSEMFAYFKKKRLYNITYRENGRHRKTRLFSSPDKSVLFHVRAPENMKEKLENTILFDRFLPQTGCLYCVDHLGFLADAAAGDAWLKRHCDDKSGTNIIICRTEKGESLVASIKNYRTEAGSLKDIEESQGVYAKSKIGHTFIRTNPQNKKFLPMHDIVRNVENARELSVELSFSDRMKFTLVKKLIRAGRFLTARTVYSLLLWRMFYNYYRRKFIKNG